MKTQMEAEMLLEAWQKLIEYVPAKDKVDAARSYVALIDDYNLDEASLQEIKDSDTFLDAAIRDYYEELEEETADEDWNSQEDW
jgi:hypothetical protein